MKKVGFIGLGIMGGPMAENLLNGGADLTVCDLNRAIVEKFVAAGAKQASAAEIGATCDVIFTILPNGSIVQDILFGEHGVASTIRPGTVVCDCSSVTPQESQTCFAKFKAMGVGFVDAPVSGGEPKAIDGTLAFMAGGEQADFDALKPFFDHMGASAMLVGASGSGSVTKLANQVIVNLNIAAVSEAFVLAAKAGVDPRKVYQAIRGGLAGSVILDAKLPKIVARDFKPGGTITVNHKDIKNVLATAHAIDVPLPLTAQLFEIMQSLKVSGHMGDDHCGLIQYFEQLANITVQSGMQD